MEGGDFDIFGNKNEIPPDFHEKQNNFPDFPDQLDHFPDFPDFLDFVGTLLEQ